MVPSPEETLSHVSPGEPRRWTFTVATPVGEIRSTYQLTPEALEFQSDSVGDGGRDSLP
ncbi:MAG TPA: hypothetical protein VFT47_03755 [Vicinamibacterales bacterium]|nr:hypothetical protein [Vicinamibacterales bacterium]